MFAASCQPTTIRLNTSITKLKYRTPAQRRKYVKSATHKAFGRSAVKSRRTRSGLLSAAGIGCGGLPRLPAVLGALDPVLGHQPLHLTARHPLAGAQPRLPHR